MISKFPSFHFSEWKCTKYENFPNFPNFQVKS